MSALDKIRRAAAGTPVAEDPAGDLVAAAAACLDDLVLLLAGGDDDGKPAFGKKKAVPFGKKKSDPDGDGDDDEDEDDDEDGDGDAAKKKKAAAAKKKAAAKKAAMTALAAGARIALAGLAAPRDGDWVELTAAPGAPWAGLAAVGISGDVPYADPGYQADGKLRLPLDAAHLHATVASFSRPAVTGAYTEAQARAIWGRVKLAAAQQGVTVSDTMDTGALVALAAAPAEGGLAMHHGPFSGTHNHAHIGAVVHSHSHMHNDDASHRCGPGGREMY